MGSSQVDALLAELLSSDEEDNHEDVRMPDRVWFGGWCG